MGAQGIVIDYKSGAASSAADIRDRDLLQLPLYMLVLRRQLGLEPVGGIYVPVGGGRRPRGMLRAGSRPGAGLQPPRLPRARRLRRGCRGSPADRRRSRRAHPQRGCPARPAGRRLPALVRLVADLQEGSAVTALPNDQQRAAIEAHGTRLRRGGRGHGQDRRARREIRPGRRGRRARRRLPARDHVHGAGRRRAARPHPRRSARAGPCRPRARARRRLDLHDPRLLPSRARRLSAGRRRRPLVPRAGRAAGARPPGGGLRGGARAILRGRRARPLAAPRDVRRCRSSPDARGGLRDASLGRARARARVRRARAAAGADRDAARGCHGTARRRGRLGSAAGGRRRGAGAARGDVPSRAPARPRGHEDARAAGRRFRRGARRAGRRRARGARRARPRAPARAPDDIRRGVRGRQGRGVGGRLRGSPAQGA